MNGSPRFAAFISDFGTADEFVGVCHAVMRGIAPELAVIDLTHEIPPFDVRAGALALVRAAQYLPEGIVLAVVDPGVGTDRRLLAVEVGGGVLVGPDNGLLAPAVAMAGGAKRVVSLTNTDYQLEAPGATFAARDIMAPACGHLAVGVAIDELGDEVDPASLVPGMVPLPDESDDGYDAEVLWVDRFGNCQLNIGPDELAQRGVDPGDELALMVNDRPRSARWVGAYAEGESAELVMVTDSYGLCSLAVDRGSAADVCGLAPGKRVKVFVSAPDGEDTP